MVNTRRGLVIRVVGILPEFIRPQLRSTYFVLGFCDSAISWLGFGFVDVGAACTPSYTDRGLP